MSRWYGVLGWEPATQSGWIPPSQRTGEAARLTLAYHLQTPHASDVRQPANVPETALLPCLELRVLGKLGLRVRQITGSCVGAGAARAYYLAIVGDIVHRGDRETVEMSFPWATWGIGRQLGGLRGRGAGSFGAAQAEAVRDWGMLRSSDQRLPQPTVQDDWVYWTERVEAEWSWPPQWPLRIDPKEPGQYQVGSVVRVTSVDDAAAQLSQGAPLTLASMFGTAGAVDRGGVVVAEWDDSWAHQMTVVGFAKHPQQGRLWLIDNQWGRASHRACPWLAQILAAEARRLGVLALSAYEGSFWITDDTFRKILRHGDTECYAHSATEGFDPKPRIDWDTVDWSKIVVQGGGS